MLKTLGKNSDGTAAALLKRCAAWVTGWWRKYRNDFFVRTGVNVIAVQILFIAIILLMFVAILSETESRIVATISASIETLIETGGAVEVDVEEQLAEQQEERLVWVLLLMSAITVLFGAIVSRLTLYPARRALAAQKQFISNVAHELRTPLAILRMNTDVALMETDRELPPGIARALADNTAELERISEILNNLLSLSSLTDPTRMKFENVDLGAIVSGAISRLGGFARKRQIKIFFEGKRERWVWGNTIALEQVVMNLLRNAILYSEAEGHITVRIEPEAAFNVLTIQDTGIGIARKDLIRILDPFYRTDQSRTRAGGGSGLGLTIVSEIIKQHRGKLIIESTPKVGTTVMVHIPRAQSEADESDAGNTMRTDSHIALDFSKSDK